MFWKIQTMKVITEKKKNWQFNALFKGIIKKRPGRPPGLTKAKILEKLQGQENGHSKNDYESLTDDDLMVGFFKNLMFSRSFS